MSNPLYTGWQRILEGQGLEVAFTGMFIVFLALATISFSIAMLPRVVAALGGMRPEHPDNPTGTDAPQDDEAVAAAVGYVLDKKNNHR